MVDHNWLNRVLTMLPESKKNIDFELVKLNPFIVDRLAPRSYDINDHVYSRSINYARKWSSCSVILFNALAFGYMIKHKSFKKGLFMGAYKVRSNIGLFVLGTLAYPELKLNLNKQRLRRIIASDEYNAMFTDEQDKLNEIRRLEFFKENCMSPNYLYDLRKTYKLASEEAEGRVNIGLKAADQVKETKQEGNGTFSIAGVRKLHERFGVDITQILT